MRDRRRFLAAIGATGAAGLAGCLGGLGGLGGDGGSDDGGTGSGDDGPSGDPTPDPDNDLIPEDRRDFELPTGVAATEFDVELREETTLVEGDDVDAVQEADTENHRYVFDESAMDAELTEGSVLLISGVALRRVTGVERDGSTATVETEFAPLTDAIENGSVGWDARLGFDPEHSPDSENREPIGRVGDSATGGPSDGDRDRNAPDGGIHGEYEAEAMTLAGVGTVDPDGTRRDVAPEDIRRTEQGFEWEFSDENRVYTFALEREGEERATVRVQVAAPADGDPNLALVAEGTVGSARSLASAEMEEGDVSSLELTQEGLGVDLTLEITGAGSGSHSIDWEIPTPFFKFVTMAGPVPITFEMKTKLIGSASIPAEATASATSEFQYRGESGFSYEGTDVNASATMGTAQLNPDSADSSGTIGSEVDLQFGVAFPRFQISVFDSLLVPYIHAGTIIGSSLTWGPVCKTSYVRFVVQTGYDLEVFGVTLASEKETLYEDEDRARGDSCEDGVLESNGDLLVPPGANVEGTPGFEASWSPEADPNYTDGHK